MLYAHHSALVWLTLRTTMIVVMDDDDDDDRLSETMLRTYARLIDFLCPLALG